MTSDIGATPWSAMDPAEKDRFGEDIFDPTARAKWCGAVALGGLPYMWTHKARIPRKIALDQLELRQGGRVYIIGEALESMGVPGEIRERVGTGGEVVVDDFKDTVRDIFFRNEDPKWQWDFTQNYPDEHFDCVLVMQGVAHAGDWTREGAELVRVLKPGRRIVLAEIAFGATFYERVVADLHIEYILRSSPRVWADHRGITCQAGRSAPSATSSSRSSMTSTCFDGAASIFSGAASRVESGDVNRINTDHPAVPGTLHR